MPQPDPPLARLLAEKLKIESGYRRVLPHADPCAVAWWFVRRERDGLVVVRGGRCRTSKLARSLIHRAAIQARQELAALPREIAGARRRPTGLLRS